MSQPKILIADDESEYVEILTSLLEAHGFEILVAHEGVRTIEAAHKQKPNLILLDLHMPAGTGQTVLQYLRSKPDTHAIPVIVITGSSESGLESRIRALGAQDFMQKPYDNATLLAKIQNLIKPQS
jgi:CheY-like chemotaxis protein